MRIMLVSKLLLPITIACTQYPFASSWSFQQPTKPTKPNNNDLKQWLGSWFQNSAWAAELHESHVVSPTVQHMMKGTPLASASVADKVSFATGPGGRLVERIMAAEQELLGEWKVRKIVEAAIGRLEPDESNESLFDVEGSHERLCDIIDGHAVVLFSFVDCPWCLLAKRMLDAEPYTILSLPPEAAIVKVIELEELGWEGKRLRASIALATGRTSMPACFIGGRSVGGFSDGFSDCSKPGVQHLRVCEGSPGMKELHDRGELMDLIEEAMKLQ